MTQRHKYDEYVKANSLDQEIDEAASGEADRQDDLPEKFKGKSPAEIARAYQELEGAYGRSQADLSNARRSIDSMLTHTRPAVEPEQKTPVTADDLYTNADGTLRRVVKEETDASVNALANRVQQAELRAAMAEFKAQNKDFDEIMKDPAFMEWIKASPYRVRAATAADRGDFDAAADLFSGYRDHKGRQVDERKGADRKTQARRASLESSAPAPSRPTGGDTYSRSALMEQRIAARRGDRKAQAFLDAHGDSIEAAYREGRLTD